MKNMNASVYEGQGTSLWTPATFTTLSNMLISEPLTTEVNTAFVSIVANRVKIKHSNINDT